MEVFFYGLFMDQDILVKNGLNPVDPRIASLSDYALKIGNRASLVPNPGEKAWGLLFKVDKSSIQALYSAPSVSDYIPEAVSVITQSGEEVAATCYNLPADHLTGTNHAYAKSLYELAKRVRLPEDYLSIILEMTK